MVIGVDSKIVQQDGMIVKNLTIQKMNGKNLKVNGMNIVKILNVYLFLLVKMNQS